MCKVQLELELAANEVLHIIVRGSQDRSRHKEVARDEEVEQGREDESEVAA